MKLRLRYTFSCLFILLGSSAFAQMPDSLRRSGVEVFLDYGKILTLASDFESKWEFGVGYRYKSRVAVTVHLGMAELNPQEAYENGTYTSEGRYGSAGLNYLLPLDATNTLYLGVQYGMSMYEDSYTYTLSSTIWPDFNDSEQREDLEADWFGLVIGSEKKLGPNGFYLGGEFSIRKLNSYNEFEPVDTYAIPGYGRSADKTVPAISLYIKYLF